MYTGNILGIYKEKNATMKTMCVSSQCSLRRVVQERRSFGVAKMVASISMRGKDVKTNGLKNRMMGMRGQNMRIQVCET